MIIFESKGYQTRSNCPNTDWTGEALYVVEDGTEIANKIKSLYPYYDFVTDEDGNLIDVVEIEPEIAPLTHEEVNARVVSKIREIYDINKEFKMINLGILNPDDAQYVTYRNYVAECIAWGNSLQSKEE